MDKRMLKNVGSEKMWEGEEWKKEWELKNNSVKEKKGNAKKTERENGDDEKEKQGRERKKYQ